MNKKVVMQIGCFLVIFALEMAAAYINPASAAHSALLIMALVLVPVFALIGRMPNAYLMKDGSFCDEISMVKIL